MFLARNDPFRKPASFEFSSLKNLTVRTDFFFFFCQRERLSWKMAFLGCNTEEEDEEEEELGQQEGK